MENEKSMWFSILPYLTLNRHFILINSQRETGKTYSTLKELIALCLKKDREIFYICRTKAELQAGALPDAFAKVLRNEYGNLQTRSTNEELSYNIGSEDEPEWMRLAVCGALSDFQRLKKRSFPKVWYMLFDEYIIEKDSPMQYVRGEREPDILLNLYQTIDRGEDRVYCIMLGNTGTFYNPYHIHPVFNVRDPGPGRCRKSINLVFVHYAPPRSWAERMEKNLFAQMVRGSTYGSYAIDGEYIEDSPEFVEPRPENARPWFTLAVAGERVGLWRDPDLVWASGAVDPSAPVVSLDSTSHTEGTVYRSNAPQLRILSNAWALGMVRFDSQIVKSRLMPHLYNI